MFHVIIRDTYDEVSDEAFRVMKEVLRKPAPVLGLATGSTPLGLYQRMVADYAVGGQDYSHVLTFNLDEYVGLPRDHEQSYWTFMHENLFNHIGIPGENVHMLPGFSEDFVDDCDEYEAMLQKHIPDIQLLGIGSNGHIAFNEPGTRFNTLSHVVDLSEQTIRDNARFFGGDVTKVPKQAVTMGLESILRSKKALLLATGANKADAVAAMMTPPPTLDCPASILQSHKDVTVILDREAASKLKNENMAREFDIET